MRFACLLLLCCISLSGAAAPSTPLTVRLCQSDGPALPAALWQRLGLQGAGDRSELMAAWLRQSQGLQVIDVRRPARRCVSELGNNEHDLYAGLSATPERLQRLAFPRQGDAVDPARRLYLHSYQWVVAGGRGWTAPAGRLCRDGNCAVEARTGTVSGYSVARELRALGYQPTLVTLDAAAALRMLAADRLDAVALQPDEALAALRANPALAARLERLHPPIAQQPYFLVASPQFAARQAALLERLWQDSQVLRQAIETP